MWNFALEKSTHMLYLAETEYSIQVWIYLVETESQYKSEPKK